MVGSVVIRDVMVVTRVKILQSDPKGKPPFEMCWLYMGIAQIALDPPPSGKRANMKKSAPKHPDNNKQTSWATWEKSAPNHSGKPYGQCPYGNNTFGKGASLTRVSFDMLFYLDILSLAWM